MRYDEQETHIWIDRTTGKAKVYTSDPNMMRRLDRYAEESTEWEAIETQTKDGGPISRTYETIKDNIILRKKKPEMSEEQRAAASERLKAWREQNANGQGKG